MIACADNKLSEQIILYGQDIILCEQAIILLRQ